MSAMQARLKNDRARASLKLDDRSGERWLKARNATIMTGGVGYTMDVTTDRSKIKTRQHTINEAALRGTTIKKQTFKKKANK